MQDATMNDASAIDLTQYAGAWPPPRDYGLSSQQAAALKQCMWHNRKMLYSFGVFLPLLAFVLPWNILDWLPPLKWVMDALGYVFPLLRVVGVVDPRPQLPQLVYATEILVALFWGIPAIVRVVRTQCALSGQSFILFGVRTTHGRRAKEVRQAYLWVGPVILCIFTIIVVMDLYGYAAFIFSGATPLQAAQAHAFFSGGILTGWGYLHGIIAPRAMGATGSRPTIYLRAFMIYSLLVSVAAAWTTAVLVLKDWHRWRANTRRDEAFLEQLYKDRKKRR